MSVASFFELEPREIVMIIEKSNEEIELKHKLEYVAMRNALGSLLSKNYKYLDLFKKETSKKEVTQEEREELKAYLENW